ncbi:MAG TPA: hypothetical protein PLH72_02855 [Vicinamibacterales bacterium]|nr:hypothetical protein [Vicinamibacterales bacterium]
MQVEFSTLGNPDVSGLLTARGYRLVGFENVLARRLSAADRPPAAGVTVSPVQAGEAASWIHALTTGFSYPDVFDGPASHESFDRAAIERTYALFGTVPGVVRLLAWLNGAVAGGASLYAP